ncbi:alpha/beta hydrolase [Arthrobacter sp. zg-Y859]|uniref:Alpha/beta hydrolase n=1 Tax=Arthrobacter jinronghuae TaxID=2964609 RepID=A0ABT1NR94_9MICC|nr:alpha/beta hydrolase [Arthrobacter jinronghuae]MCQ1949617.1 alpha/beta hydrolase [Arthrobacter jinronghuae]UWX77617.1 alpha/beta hydrolase [Arthrobacter jinronghuae]
MRRLSSLGVAVSLALATAPATATAAEPDVTELGGTLPGGATWAAQMPEDWNGKLVLYSHGFRPGPDNPAEDPGFESTAQALTARGFAVASSSYASAGWALGTAVEDQLGTLAAFSAAAGEPVRTIAFGTSMGGLVSSLIAETPDSGVDGAVSTCGLLGGGINLNNYQLDGIHALAELLLPGTDLQLTGFRTAEEAGVTIDALMGAVQQAQATPEGRARLALAAALMNTPTWFSGDMEPDRKDFAAQQEAQYNWLLQTIPFVVGSRASIVNAADGDSGWNEGVDYRSLLRDSAQRQQVKALYRSAGLDLRRDLHTLTSTADIAPDPEALDWMDRTSTPHGDLLMPVLTMHTLADILAPVQYMEEYAETVRDAGAGALLRQSYVERTGHCTFTDAERVGAVLAMDERLDTGRWGNLAEPRQLDRAAESLGLGEADFIRYRPEEFVNDRSYPQDPGSGHGHGHGHGHGKGR